MRRKATRKSGNLRRPKTKLGLPDLDHSKSAVLNSLRSPESKRGYRHAIDEFIQWYCSEPRLSLNKVVLTRYRIYLEDRRLAPGTINGRLAAVRRLAYEAADAGLLSPELAASIRRVKGVRKLGVRLGNWLTAEEARQFWQAPSPNTIKGRRDRAILAILLGCGLRRGELADLEFTHLQRRDEHWAIVDLVGKGGHIRTVPVARLGQGRGRSVGRRSRHISREVVSLCLPCWQVLGRRRDGARRLACGQRLCEKDRSEPSCPARPSSFVRETMSHRRRRIGTDSIPPRPRFGTDYGALPWLQTADQRSGQRPHRN
jgi:integrase